MFDALNVNHELVLTSNRKSFIFDEKFESYHVLDKYLFYFPKEDKYLEPLSYGTRFGFPNGYLTNNNGLFIKRTKIGDFESATGEVKYISPVNYDKSSYDLVMDLTFDKEDLNKTIINLDRTLTGYYAVSLQPFFGLMNEENKEKTLKGIVKSIKEDVEITSVEALNASSEKFGVDPLIIKASLTSNSFIDNAGNKFLFKVGDFERSYVSKINVNLPAGYSFKNLEDLNISESFEENGTTYFSFKSKYILENNSLKIQINEFYNKNIIEVPFYESYRKVINSAANFNKVVLIMVKN